LVTRTGCQTTVQEFAALAFDGVEEASNADRVGALTSNTPNRIRKALQPTHANIEGERISDSA
jgi:hypothetical protein